MLPCSALYLHRLFLARCVASCQLPFQEVTAALRATCLSTDKIPRPSRTEVTAHTAGTGSITNSPGAWTFLQIRCWPVKKNIFYVLSCVHVYTMGFFWKRLLIPTRVTSCKRSVNVCLLVVFFGSLTFWCLLEHPRCFFTGMVYVFFSIVNSTYLHAILVNHSSAGDINQFDYNHTASVLIWVLYDPPQSV